MTGRIKGGDNTEGTKLHMPNLNNLVKRKKSGFLYLIFLILLVMLLTYAVTVLIRFKAESRNRYLGDNISDNSYNMNTIKELNAIKSLLDVRQKAVEAAREDNIIWSEAIDKIMSIMPESISLINLNGTSGRILLQCASKDMMSIPYFIDELNKIGEYTGVWLTGINPEGQNGELRFEIELKLKPREASEYDNFLKE